ncbi:hypothetical protein LSH36_622g00007 [Paralvinella palmiformis]|uniref:Uncharacterized protein n=1 Tax=Paralvinella palmiformis TaxID=53620 RepID=A0AAD9J407_9ANNE|nr:hypothetical protein LSH36_622g00007 [Paralvinella palmiformis]
MLRFLQDMARSAAGFLHSTHGSDRQSMNSGASGSREYTDKYSNKVQRGFIKQKYKTEVWENIQETQQKARRLISENQTLNELKALLHGCSNITEVINIRDMFGYNLLQYAITSNRVAVVRYLVMQGADLNLPICARPLHLAAKLGHADILQVLLECGADPDVMSCVCYPQSHILQRTMFVSDSECWSVACFGDIYASDKICRVQFEYPLYYAIMSDSIECVKLLTDQGGTQLSSRSLKLHTACCFGAFQCIQHFLKSNPLELSTGDHKGLYPLQYAVQWGKKITEYLVLKGALVTVKTAYRESLLMLFYNQSRAVPGLAETSSYLLDCGLRMMVNVVDAGGNSPLHALFNKLHRTPPKWPASQLLDNNLDDETLVASGGRPRSSLHSQALRSRMKSYFELDSVNVLRTDDTKTISFGNLGQYSDIPLSDDEQEYLDSAMLLVKAGANTNVVNKVGNSCLHQLLKIQMQDVAGITDDALGKYKYCSLRMVYCLLCLLLEYGANPRFINNMHVTVHGSLISSAVDALFSPHLGEPLRLADPVELFYLVRCIELLCKHGCTFSTNCASAPLHHTLSKLDALETLRNYHQMSTQDKSDLATQYTRQVMQIVNIVLTYGGTPTDLHSLYYQLVNQYPLVSADVIREAVVLLLHHGADPNVGGIHIPMSVFRSRTGHSHWPVYPLLHLLNLIGSASMDHEGIPDLCRLFDLLYNAMNESGARQCMFHFLYYDSNQSQAAKHRNTELLSRIEMLMVTPRTLRQITAQWIFVKMCNRQKANVIKLPYPSILKRLILSIQY